MAAKDEYPQCPPWETQKAEENTALFNAVFNTKHKETDCGDVLGEREDAKLGLTGGDSWGDVLEGAGQDTSSPKM